jgi:hypothetical protein
MSEQAQQQSVQPSTPAHGVPATAQQPYFVPPAQQPQQPKNGAGLAALIIGIVAVFLCWIPIVGYVSVILGVVGIALTIVGLVNVRRRLATNSAVTIIGGILNVVALILPWVFLAMFVSAVDDAVNEFDRYSDCIVKADTPAEMDACEDLN